MLLPDKDNEFDDLIKEAAEKYEAPGTNADWDRMKGLLDKQMPEKKDSRRWVFFILFLLLGLLAGGYLYFNQVNELVSMRPVKEHKPAITPPVGLDSSQAAARTDVKKGQVQGETTKVSQVTQGLTTDDKIARNETGKNKSINHRYKLTGRRRVRTNVGEVSENDPLVKAGKENAAVDKNKNANQINDLPEQAPAKDNVDTGANKSLNKTKSPTEPSTGQNQLHPLSSDTTNNKQKKDVNKGKPSFEFSVLYAPELTTIGFSKFDKPGSNYGFLVGYPVSKKVTIQTGLIKSKKNYIANGEDYKMDYAMPGNHKLEKVQGYCMMYEIPLNIKSPITTGKKINFFYTAGLSTYIMTEEFYTYTVSTNTGSYDKDMLYNNTSNYWFSVIGASIGVEKKITNKLDFSAAPFIKIPLTGMGDGELKLTGLGINFLLTYKPWNGKK